MTSPLTRTFGLLVVAAATVVGLFVLRDATKFEGERSDTGETRVVFTVEAKKYGHDLQDAAASLWYACVGSVSWEESDSPQATGDQEGEFVAAVRPALGEDSRRRFRGCLEDATVDKLSGDVVAMDSYGIDP